jgi:DNA polymerase-3 subunit alpha
MDFANLHGHTTFSFGDGFGTPAQHFQRAAELGYTAMAVTEHGNTSSHFQAEKAGKKAGVKPVFGLEAYTGPTNIEGSPARSQWKHHLTILAADDEGYRNLNRIVTQSYIDFHYHPTVGGRSLAEHAEGLVVLSGCSGSQLACALLGGKGTPEHIDDPDFEAARAVIERFVAVFGDNYYLEVQPFYELPRSCAMNTAYAELSHQTGVPLVVTHDVHYPAMADAEMQAVLHAVHRGKASVDDAMREWNYAVPLTLPETDAELVERLVKTGLTGRRAWSAVVTSGAIADRCNVTLPRADRLRYPATEEDMEPWV